jgi:G3E family GTPase
MKLILVGGFLGSGKTTAIVNACRHLMGRGKQVAVVSNDQGDQQVDSHYVHSIGIHSREVANGCFCCNYNDLEQQLHDLHEQQKPDFVFAESVGSCTDLLATVVKPFSQRWPELDIAPISVFTDATLIASILEGKASFLEESVRYIFKKQIEEGDFVVLNKTDLLTVGQLMSVLQTIRLEYPGKEIITQNSLLVEDASRWFSKLENGTSAFQKPSLNIDYQIYGAGETMLSWLDRKLVVRAPHKNATTVAQELIGAIFDQIQFHRLPIGHLKFFVETSDWSEKISFTTTSTSGEVGLHHPETNEVSILINARIQTSPDFLGKIVDNVLTKIQTTFNCEIELEKWALFQPDFPRPTHRIA